MKNIVRAVVTVLALAASGMVVPATAHAAKQVLCSQGGYDCLTFSGYSASAGGWANRRYGSAGGLTLTDNHNCTRYVAYRLEAGGVGDQPAWGNAEDWWQNAPGAKNNTPSVGAVAYWSYGHVGVVEAVHGDGSVEVTWDSAYGPVGTAREILSGANLPYGYIHIDDAAIARSGGKSGHSPEGSLDEVSSPDAGAVKVRGWAFDRDAAARAIRVHVYIGGEAGDPDVDGHEITADGSRPDVDQVHGTGANHGFEKTLTTRKTGVQKVCVYGINEGEGDNSLIDCRNTTIESPNPFGFLDSATGGAGEVKVRGWAADWNAPSESLKVHLYQHVNGGQREQDRIYLGELTANKTRSDVNKARGVTGKHGFDGSVKIDATGSTEICAYGINKGRGGNSLLSCLTTTVAAADTGGASTKPTSSSPTSTTSPVTSSDTGSVRGNSVSFESIVCAAIGKDSCTRKQVAAYFLGKIIEKFFERIGSRS